MDDGQWSGLGDVRVMNIWTVGHVGEEEEAKQDVLVLIPGAPSLAALGLGVALAGWRRRHA